MDIVKKLQAWLPIGVMAGVVTSVLAWAASQLPSLVITLSTVDINVREQITQQGVEVPYATNYVQSFVAKYLFGLTFLQNKTAWIAPVIMSIIAAVILVSVGVIIYHFVKFPKAKSAQERVWYVLAWAAVVTFFVPFIESKTIPALNLLAAVVIYYFVVSRVVGFVASTLMKKNIPE
jgi:uncharacterized membrane protein YeaQ/YmgE (transglycosylase-associated protein family)